MKLAILFSIFVLSVTGASANQDTCTHFLESMFQDTSGKFVNLANGQKIYTQFTAPGKGKPIYVLVNGLVYNTERWDKVAAALVKNGNGVLRYEFVNQGKTLAMQEKAAAYTSAQQASDLLELIQKHKLKNEDIHLVGLSYGSTIATEFAKRYPKEIKSLTLASPLVVSSEKYSAVGQLTRSSLEMYKFFGTYEMMYENTYRNFFRSSIKNSPHPSIELKKYQDALYELGKSVRDYDLKQEIKLIKDVPIKMVVAGLEEAPAKADMMKVVGYLKSMGSVKITEIPDAYHALPDHKPDELTKFLLD